MHAAAAGVSDAVVIVSAMVKFIHGRQYAPTCGLSVNFNGVDCS